LGGLRCPRAVWRCAAARIFAAAALGLPFGQPWPLSAFHFLFSVFRFQLSIFRFAFSIFHFPLSIFHFLLSIFRFPFSAFHFQLSIFHFPLSTFPRRAVTAFFHAPVCGSRPAPAPRESFPAPGAGSGGEARGLDFLGLAGFFVDFLDAVCLESPAQERRSAKAPRRQSAKAPKRQSAKAAFGRCFAWSLRLQCA
jgi:hypothetical protein